MKKVVIIDDEPLARTLVKEYLQGHPGLQVAAECSNGYEGVKAIMNHKPDLIFLDVQMPKISGFEMLELIDQLPAVIFTTAFDEYAMQAFEANAIDYLLKPYSKERFDTALQKWKSVHNQEEQETNLKDLLEHKQKTGEEQSRVVVRRNSDIFIISATDIHYIEAYDDYVKIFTEDNYYLKKKTLGFYEQHLSKEHFFRTHRSFLINLKQLTRIEPFEKNSYLALLKSGKKIPLSRSGYAALKQKLGI